MVAADSDADGISVAADAISLNGGSIKAAADGTTDADLAHAALTPARVTRWMAARTRCRW